MNGVSFPDLRVYADKEDYQMTETDDEAIKVEIDEIMNRVKAIMEKVVQVIPEERQETDGQK